MLRNNNKLILSRLLFWFCHCVPLYATTWPAAGADMLQSEQCCNRVDCQVAVVEDVAVKTWPDDGAVELPILTVVVAESKLLAAIVFVVNVNVLLVNVCVSDIPTN